MVRFIPTEMEPLPRSLSVREAKLLKEFKGIIVMTVTEASLRGSFQNEGVVLTQLLVMRQRESSRIRVLIAVLLSVLVFLLLLYLIG